MKVMKSKETLTDQLLQRFFLSLILYYILSGDAEQKKGCENARVHSV
jgi:hypothetical protein